MKIFNLNNLQKEETIILNKIFLKYKKKFIKELDDFLENDNPFSLIHPLLSKLNDNYLLYKEYCYLKLCKILIVKNKSKKIKIITRNLSEYFFLKENLNKNVSLLFEKKNFFLNIFFIPKLIYRILKILLFIFFEITNKSKERAEKISSRKNINLYENPLLKSMFKKKNFRNRFFSEIFKDNNFMFVTNLTFSHTKKNFKILKDKNLNFVSYGDFLDLKDFICAMIISIKKNIKKNKYFKDQKININSLMTHDIYISRANFNYFIGILNYLFFKKIENRVKINKVFNWNENRPSDKGLIFGCKKFSKETKIIAKRNFFIDYKYNFQYQISNFDYKHNLYPTNVLMVDHDAIKKASELENNINYSEDFDKSRFNFKNQKIINIENKTNTLVILPIIKKEAEFILNCIYKISDNPELRNFNFFIKPHPSYENSLLIKIFKIKIKLHKKNISFLTEYLKDEEFLYVIGNATSGLVEYFHKNKKILVLKNSENFIDNPISNKSERVILCHDLNDILLSLKNISIN